MSLKIHMNLLHVRDVFLDAYLKKEEESSKATIANYRSTVKKFNDFITETRQTTPRVEHFTADNLRDFIDYRGLGDGMYHQEFSRLKAFGTWLVREKYIPDNPMLKIKRRKSRNRTWEQAFFPMEKAEDFRQAGAERHPRDEALFLFYIDSGRREYEALGMRIKDLKDFRTTSIFPDGYYTYTDYKNGGQEHEKPMDPGMMDYLKVWLEEYRRLAVEQSLLDENAPLPQTWYLFPAFRRGRGHKLNPTSQITNLWTITNPIFKSLGVYQRGAGLHQLRRAAADLLAEMTSIRMAMLKLGHSNERTTEIYLNRKREQAELVQALRRVHDARHTPKVDQNVKEVQEPHPTSDDYGAQVVNIASYRPIQKRFG